MSEYPGYRPRGTAGGRCGCAAGVLPLILLGPVGLMVLSLGHCDAGYPCRRDQSRDFPSWRRRRRRPARCLD
jgi:hypothetical protein